MATDVRSQHKHYDIIRCKLCNKIYNQPRILSCLHSFCSGCLDNHISTTTKPSDETFKCPECNDIIDVPATGVAHGLIPNTVLIRFIDQAQKDKVSLVAGREVLQMSYEALTESELKCPQIVASLQEIADTAGNVLADNVQNINKSDDLENLKVKQEIQLKTTTLQEKAMNLVQCIDQVNISQKDWIEKRTQIRDSIKMRSAKIQDDVKSIERQLIARLEDRDNEQEMKDEAFAVKNKLHKVLQSSLSMVDFLRLLMEYGNKEEMEVFGSMATQKEEKMHNQPVKITKCSYTFDAPKVDIYEGLEMMFGGLSEIEEENTVWDPNKSFHHRPLPQISENQSNHDSALYFEETESSISQMQTTRESYTEVNESGQLYSDSVSELENRYSEPNRYSRRQFSAQTRNKRYTMPTKSQSFDASIPESPYHYIQNENQELYNRILHSTNHIKEDNSSFQILNENGGDKSTIESERSNTLSQQSQNVMHSAINTLEESSMGTEPYRPWSRRVSAPPSLLLDALNRKRLSALSILERSNISTEGLNITSDIESGMNEARMEWLRDNVRRKTVRQENDQPV
ncbi:hypothetical protein ACF0H5_021427 [Mactra antiquata]